MPGDIPSKGKRAPSTVYGRVCTLKPSSLLEIRSLVCQGAKVMSPGMFVCATAEGAGTTQQLQGRVIKYLEY